MEAEPAEAAAVGVEAALDSSSVVAVVVVAVAAAAWTAAAAAAAVVPVELVEGHFHSAFD